MTTNHTDWDTITEDLYAETYSRQVQNTYSQQFTDLKNERDALSQELHQTKSRISTMKHHWDQEKSQMSQLINNLYQNSSTYS